MKEGHHLMDALNGSLHLLGVEWTSGDKSGSRKSSLEATEITQRTDGSSLDQGHGSRHGETWLGIF